MIVTPLPLFVKRIFCRNIEKVSSNILHKLMLLLTRERRFFSFLLTHGSRLGILMLINRKKPERKWDCQV